METTNEVRVIDLINAGLIRPPLQLEREYKGVYLTATIRQDGSIIFGGTPYSTLSVAAGMARKTIIGTPPGYKYPQTNGWTFWKYRNPQTGGLEEIDSIRKLYRSYTARKTEWHSRRKGHSS